MNQDQGMNLVLALVVGIVIVGVVVFLASRARKTGGNVADKADTTIDKVFDSIETDTKAN